MGYITLQTKDYLKDNYDVFVNKVSDGENCFHAHEFIEFSYVEKGQGTHWINGIEEPLETGDIYIINANIPHEYRVLNQDFTIYNCIFQPYILDNSFQNHSNFVGMAYDYLFHSLNMQPDAKSYIRLSAKRVYQIGELFREMYSEYNSKKNGYIQILHSNIKKLLVYMFRLYRDDNSQMQNPALYKQMIIESVKKYILNNHAQSLKCGDLAKQVYLSTGYLSRIFKENTGKTVIEYLQEIRVNHACDLLKTTDLNISKIMELCGYSDVKHFYEVFYKQTAKTPGLYRK